MARNKSIFIIIYLVTLGFLLQYNLTHPIVNDGVYEYRDYLLNIQEGGWKFRYSSVNSCLVSIWIPSLIQRWTNWDTMTIFRAFPTLFYALMPSFVFLIARRYFTIRYSVVSALVIILSSYIIFFPDVGRVGVSLGLMAGMVWALLSKKLVWAVVFAFLVVFSHYGTSIISAGLVLAVLGLILLSNKFNMRKVWAINKIYVITLLVLLISIGVWHFGIARYSGNSMLTTLVYPDKARGILDVDSDIFSLASRDYVTQSAFGMNFVNNPIPFNIEIIANWVIVLLITLGGYVVLRNKSIDNQFKFMAVIMYALILATIAIPDFSNFYGTQRVYFTASILLAVCFPFGIQWVAKKIHINQWIITSVVLGIYGLSTSGVIYMLFGIIKTIPIVLRLP